jgi:5-methylcytosine-specific restriction endonuclease McrA
MLTDRSAAVSLSTMDLPQESKPLNAVAAKALELLIQNPEGLDIEQIRAMLGIEGQQHLDRRLRDLRKYYHVPCVRKEGRQVYVYQGPKADVITDSGAISGKQRARILDKAKGRCQMCGKTVAEDGIKFQIDHKLPQAWGGLTVDENLWAICEPCNNGKRDHFNSYDPAEMTALLAYESVHERIAHLLKLHMGQPVDSDIIEFVANATERQEDWQKRLRDLRYPVVGLDIKAGRRKTPEGFWRSTYTLLNWRDLPPNHRKLIQDWEKPAKRAELKLQLGIS